jgi:hypothetical protein
MHTFVLQEWTTIRGASSGSGLTIVQSERDWLDLSPFQDLFAWVDVREVTGANVNLFFDTSPTEDENFFVSMTGATSVTGGVLAAATNPVIAKLPMLTATVPLSRYLRWRLTSTTGTWDVTMRIVVAANSPGM